MSPFLVFFYEPIDEFHSQFSLHFSPLYIISQNFNENASLVENMKETIEVQIKLNIYDWSNKTRFSNFQEIHDQSEVLSHDV